jgi:hypothetical protein
MDDVSTKTSSRLCVANKDNRRSAIVPVFKKQTKLLACFGRLAKRNLILEFKK